MIIAVYTIALNEEKHIERWAASCADADVRIVVDTGSTDDTVRLAEEAGCTVYSIKLQQWRFDHARNISLAFVPIDVDMCISLDADEVLVSGWRAHLEALDPSVTRPRYKYTWSWNSNGSPGLQYEGDKIHSRHGYYWKHPVHEVITPEIDEVQAHCGVEVWHFPDDSKGRNYLPLLEVAVEEDPEDDRNAHYLAREYFYRGDLDKAAAEFMRHLALPRAQWVPERAKSMRFLAKCIPSQAEQWLLRAVAEDPLRRENWMDLAAHYHKQEQWEECLFASSRAVSITGRSLDYLSEAEAWGYAPYDFAALSAWHLGMYQKAYLMGCTASAMAPDDQRLSDNLVWYAEEQARRSQWQLEQT